jgi:hypothetical protein
MVLKIAKTFQNLSIPFIFLRPVLSIRENVPLGDPNISAHPAVNRSMEDGLAAMATLAHESIHRTNHPSRLNTRAWRAQPKGERLFVSPHQ